MFRTESKLEITDIAFELPPDFDVHAYLADGAAIQSMISVQMRFLPAGAHLARHNHAYWEAMDEWPDGSIIVTFAAPTPVWAASTAMSYGGIVEVLDPPEIRQMVREWAQAILAQYDSGAEAT